MRKILMFILPLFLSGCLVTGQGEKRGEIVKLAQEGVVCKTWEGELIRGGMSNGSGSFGVRPFAFTVENLNLLEKVKFALENNKEVKLVYHHEAFTFCRSERQKIGSGSDDYDGGNFLDDIQFIN
jgi:hypothetical protein